MFWRASSNFSFLLARICVAVCGGACGASRRIPLTTRTLGRRGGCARRGATTSMLGSAVVPLPAGAAVCDCAVLPNAHNSSDAELEASNLRLNENDIVLILPKPNPNQD